MEQMMDLAKRRAEISAILADIEVASQVTGYQRKHTGTGEIIGVESLDLPTTRLRYGF